MTQPFHPIVSPFYAEALTVNSATTPTAVLDRLLSDDFRSVSNVETKDRATLIKQFEFIWKTIPDLRWEVKELIVAGDRVVARSIARGSPNGPFMGMILDGGRSFEIDTIDIHTIADGRIRIVHHVEDWATAMRQLRG